MIRNIAYVMIASLLIFGSSAFAQNKSTTSSYGEKIDASNAINASMLEKHMGDKETMNVKVKGKVMDVCQRKGCWMNLDLGNGKEMMVRFKDYAFFVPKDCAGKTVVVDGVAVKEVTTVEELRHYADDAGKSKEEIEKITQPEKSTAFEATGVLIYNE